MKQTTQCYLERGSQYLMLHRTKNKMMKTTTSGLASVVNLKKGKALKTA